MSLSLPSSSASIATVSVIHNSSVAPSHTSLFSAEVTFCQNIVLKSFTMVSSLVIIVNKQHHCAIISCRLDIFTYSCVFLWKLLCSSIPLLVCTVYLYTIRKVTVKINATEWKYAQRHASTFKQIHINANINNKVTYTYGVWSDTVRQSHILCAICNVPTVVHIHISCKFRCKSGTRSKI